MGRLQRTVQSEELVYMLAFVGAATLLVYCQQSPKTIVRPSHSFILRVVCMHNPAEVGREKTTNSDESTTSRLQYYGGAVTGLGAVAAVVFFFGPLLIQLTEPFAVLSSTMLVFCLVALWVLVWISFELAWEWQAGRFAA
jgi:hypothetical protein